MEALEEEFNTQNPSPQDQPEEGPKNSEEFSDGMDRREMAVTRYRINDFSR
jgi:hypothetical protein